MIEPYKITKVKVLKQGFEEPISPMYLYKMKVEVEFNRGRSQKAVIGFLENEKKWFVTSLRNYSGVTDPGEKEKREIMKKELLNHPSIKLKLLFAKQEIGFVD